MPVHSPYPDVEIPDVSLFDFLFTDFGERAGAPALIDGASGTAITFGELRGMVEKIAAALAERGIGAGDVVALFAPNTPHYVAVFHGVLRANAIVTSVNSLYTPGELAHQLADVRDDQVLHDGVERQGRRRIGERHARLAGAGLAKVDLAATAVDRLGQVDRRLVMASLTRHGVAIRRGVVNVPARVRST